MIGAGTPPGLIGREEWITFQLLKSEMAQNSINKPAKKTRIRPKWLIFRLTKFEQKCQPKNEPVVDGSELKKQVDHKSINSKNVQEGRWIKSRLIFGSSFA